MNKFLFGTTALVASGMIAGSAFAADPIKLQVNGNYDASVVVHDDDAEGTGDSTIKQDVELNINGSTVLDSGVTVGANIEIKEQVDGSALNNEEAFAYLEGGMGRVEIGSTDSAAFKMAYVAPSPTDAYGVDTPTFLNVSRHTSRTSARILMSADANKVTYFTPRMSGFQLGLSYTPSNDGSIAPGPGAGVAGGPGSSLGTSNPATGTGYSNGLGVRSDANGGLEDILELGGSYVGEFSNIGVKLSAAYAVGDWQAFGLLPSGNGIGSPVSSNAEAWHFGGNFTTMGWTLGGAYYGSNNLIPGGGVPGAGRPGRDEEAWNLGVTYAAGPWQAGVSYLHSEQQSRLGAPGQNEFRLWDIGAQYKLGPGVAIGSDLTFARDKVAGKGTNMSPKNLEDKALALTLMLDF